jgi:hypothetical protein
MNHYWLPFLDALLITWDLGSALYIFHISTFMDGLGQNITMIITHNTKLQKSLKSMCGADIHNALKSVYGAYIFVSRKY